uniref:Synaptojanin 2 n=1 Tax=Rousettus aegyptiacus TaxID=9407 RepID=A0A7J8KHW5_ROUAE|nr:synaptojanin 2 [Rousettus aegyptiacus]
MATCPTSWRRSRRFTWMMACRLLSRSEAPSRCFGSSQGFRWVIDEVCPRVLLSAFSSTQPCSVSFMAQFLAFLLSPGGLS